MAELENPTPEDMKMIRAEDLLDEALAETALPEESPEGPDSLKPNNDSVLEECTEHE